MRSARRHRPGLRLAHFNDGQPHDGQRRKSIGEVNLHAAGQGLHAGQGMALEYGQTHFFLKQVLPGAGPTAERARLIITQHFFKGSTSQSKSEAPGASSACCGAYNRKEMHF